MPGALPKEAKVYEKNQCGRNDYSPSGIIVQKHVSLARADNGVLCGVSQHLKKLMSLGQAKRSYKIFLAYVENPCVKRFINWSYVVNIIVAEGATQSIREVMPFVKPL